MMTQSKILVCSTCKKKYQSDSLPKFCLRCHSKLHERIPQSYAKTLALTLAALLLYIPANLYPIMTLEFMQSSEASTIFEGIKAFFENKMYFIGLVVFVASVFIPLLKILSLLFLVFFARSKTLSPKEKIKLYHFIDFIGKWSMVDIYVITILSGLVDMGGLVKISGGIGASFFTLVVILTILAAKSYDPRLLWDPPTSPQGEAHD